eukprot:TRINITY_DN13304_c0_g1_i1.p1 TRINITY_DN13304_c0_g1~~TRINITY_DN13304_c0_g1_i1.p1  ORF type:complete len:666 (+),score=263.19 TRINITY_DN13304_c0_g1_i1:104-2101(+)
MFAQWLSDASKAGTLFPGLLTDSVDRQHVAPSDVLHIDPSTYPAVGMYVPDPKDEKNVIAKKRLSKGPKVPVKRVMGYSGGRPKVVGLPSLRERDGESSLSSVEGEEEEGLPNTFCVSHVVKGPYTAETGYTTVLTTVYYQPPRPKETGETAEQINARIHPPTVLPAREMRVKEMNARRAVLYKIGPGAVAFKVVLNTFDNAGMRHTPESNWNILWAKRIDPATWGTMSYYQKVNHFPGSWGIGRKDHLHRNVSRFRKAFGEPYLITPESWILPQETRGLAAHMAQHPGTTYILKPCASSCGKGIRLIQKMPQNRVKSSVVQRYIPNPFLIEGRKFDLRIYVAVTGFDPLKLFIFDEGLCRFAAEKYPGPNAKLGCSYAHLTNYSISKTATLKTEEAAAAEENGGAAPDAGPRDIKWMLSELKAWFYEQGDVGRQKWAFVAEQVQDVIIKTMITVETDVCTAAQKQCRYPDGHGCFELFGFDLMMDSNLKVYVLEANIMPSLATGNPMDKAVKNRLLSHLLTLVGVTPYDRATAAEEEDKGFFHRSTRELNRPCTFVNGRVPTGRKRSETKMLFDHLTDCDRRVIIEAEHETHRAGGFTRVFPTYKTWEKYSKYFDYNRYNNELLARWEAEKEGERMRQQQEAGHPPTPTPVDWDIPVPMRPPPE